MKLFIGLMSGTSMDGIDAALIDLDSHRLIAGIMRPYSPDIKQKLNQLLTHQMQGFKSLSQLNTLIGREFAKAALDVITQAKVRKEDIHAIGSHGQTIGHEPTADIPYTLQLGCAHTIAEFTGLPVVADFRSRDLVVGGEGAPFAPLYHQKLFVGHDYPVAIVNIGGIANITCLANQHEVSGYDTGPGNVLMDAWTQHQRGEAYDMGGGWAAEGQVIEPLLAALLSDDYFKRLPPKSTAREYFSLQWLGRHLHPEYAAVDVQATLLQLTAYSIAQALKTNFENTKTLFVCGGGTHNLTLMKRLASLLPDVEVDSTKAVNIDPDFIEAAMFAWLAEKTLSNTAVDLTHITGAKRLAVLGAIYPVAKQV